MRVRETEVTRERDHPSTTVTPRPALDTDGGTPLPHDGTHAVTVDSTALLEACADPQTAPDTAGVSDDALGLLTKTGNVFGKPMFPARQVQYAAGNP